MTIAILIAVLYTARLIRQLRQLSNPVSQLLRIIFPRDLLVFYTFYALPNLPPPGLLHLIGLLIYALGIALWFQAIRQLGPMYTLTGSTQQNHRLITTGLYACVRHPIYLAYLIETAGLILILQNPFLILFWLLMLAVWTLAIRQEEQQLRQTFDPGYATYAGRVPALNILTGCYRRFAKTESHNSPPVC